LIRAGELILEGVSVRLGEPALADEDDLAILDHRVQGVADRLHLLLVVRLPIEAEIVHDRVDGRVGEHGTLVSLELQLDPPSVSVRIADDERTLGQDHVVVVVFDCLCHGTFSLKKGC